MGLFRKYSDIDIIDGIRRQDTRILAHLYDSYLEMISDHLRKNGGTSDDVHEVLQESVVILYRQVTGEGFRLAGDLKGYFFGIARNVWNAHLRHRSRLVPLSAEHADSSAAEEISKAALERIVARSFTLLAGDCQMVLTLYGDGYSYDEIARRMGLKTEAYARRKKYLCKEALMEIIKTDPEYQDLGPL